MFDVSWILYPIMQNDEAALLQGEKEAEKMIVKAYSALLLAFLSTERLSFLSIFSSSVQSFFHCIC